MVRSLLGLIKEALILGCGRGWTGLWLMTDGRKLRPKPTSLTFHLLVQITALFLWRWLTGTRLPLYFKFLNCWVDHDAFLDTVKECRNREVQGNPMWVFHRKMRRLSNTLSSWSRSVFGDIFAKVSDYEDRVRLAEENLINNCEDNRTALRALNVEYIR